jgi:tyrosine-protein phosphatase non-receptor type 13 protein
MNTNIRSKDPRSSPKRLLYEEFDWLEIENICFSKHILCVVVRKNNSLSAKEKNRVKFKLKMDNRKWVPSVN